MAANSVVMPTTDNVAHPRNMGYQARLDELLLRLAITPESQLEIEVVEPQAPRIQLGGAFSALPEATMAVSLGDVSGGEGLFHSIDLNHPGATLRDATRFYRSRGIDTSAVAGNTPKGFSLLHGTELSIADVSAATPYLIGLGQDLFYTDGPDVKKITTPLDVAATSTEDPFAASAADLTGLTKIGGELFASMNAASGISKRSVAGAWAVIGAVGLVYGLWSAKGQLLAAHDQVLDTIDTVSGAAVTLLTLPPGAVVTAVADAGDVVLIADSTGSVRSFAPDASAVLSETSEARVGISSTESVTAMAAGFGIVLIGTKEPTPAGGTFGRLYSAEVSASDSSFRLVRIQLVKEFDRDEHAHSHHPTTIGFRKTSAYVAVRGADETILWRYQLATQGLSEDLVFPIEAEAFGLAVLEDRIVVSLSEIGLWRESANFLTEGYVISSFSDFSFATQKNWAWLNFLGSGMGSGSTAEVAITSSHAAMDNPLDPNWITVLTIYDEAGLGALAPIFDVEERELAMKVTLSSGGGGSAPRAESASVYAYPITDELRVRIPVNVSDRLERHGRRPVVVRGYGNHYYRELLSRRGQSAELELYRQGITIRGVVENVPMATPGEGKRSSGMLVAFVVFKGRVLQLGQAGAVSPSTLGVGGTLGIEFTLGV
jgi:hypothetical protein